MTLKNYYYYYYIIYIFNKFFTSCHAHPQGHMKHHGVVTKPARPPARSSRSSSERLPSSTPATTSCNVPATRSSGGFWNQYQAFLNTSTDPTEDQTQCIASGSRGDDAEMPRLADSPVRAQMDPPTGRGLEETSQESDEEPTLESMWLAGQCAGALYRCLLFGETIWAFE